MGQYPDSRPCKVAGPEIEGRNMEIEDLLNEMPEFNSGSGITQAEIRATSHNRNNTVEAVHSLYRTYSRSQTACQVRMIMAEGNDEDDGDSDGNRHAEGSDHDSDASVYGDSADRAARKISHRQFLAEVRAWEDADSNTSKISVCLDRTDLCWECVPTGTHRDLITISQAFSHHGRGNETSQDQQIGRQIGIRQPIS